MASRENPLRRGESFPRTREVGNTQGKTPYERDEFTRSVPACHSRKETILCPFLPHPRWALAGRRRCLRTASGTPQAFLHRAAASGLTVALRTTAVATPPQPRAPEDPRPARAAVVRRGWKAPHDWPAASQARLARWRLLVEASEGHAPSFFSIGRPCPSGPALPPAPPGSFKFMRKINK